MRARVVQLREDDGARSAKTLAPVARVHALCSHLRPSSDAHPTADRPGARIDQALILRTLAGALAAGLIAARARRAGSLSPSGQWTAFASGTLAAWAGVAWAGVLFAFFVSSTALTRWGAARKVERTQAVVPKGGERDALQVLANGGAFIVLCTLGTAAADRDLLLAALASIAAASADTWSTEVGTLLGRSPRSIITWRKVAPGTSGGVTLTGFIAGAAGAAFIAALSTVFFAAPERATGTLVVFAGGCAGTVADSLLGASVQSRRWCEQCRQWTERRVHPCGYRTQHRRGMRWVTNDVVNLLGTLVGAAVAMALVTFG